VKKPSGQRSCDFDAPAGIRGRAKCSRRVEAHVLLNNNNNHRTWPSQHIWSQICLRRPRGSTIDLVFLLDVLDRQVIVAARTEVTPFRQEVSLIRESTMLMLNRSPQLQHRKAPVHRRHTARDKHLNWKCTRSQPSRNRTEGVFLRNAVAGQPQ
jgi:hypothetical protein